MGFWWTISSRQTTRRLTGLVALFTFVALSLPLPLSSGPNSDKDRSQPFPCQNRPCGCRSAQHCWQKCCCFTNAQKVAWARRHRVAVPEQVLAAARREESPFPKTAKSCCSKPAQAPVDRQLHLAHSSQDAALSVGETEQRRQAPAAARTSSPRPASKVVIGALAGQCQGQDWTRFVVPAWILPTARVPAPPVVPSVSTCVPASEAVPVLSHQPPVPPPRPADVPTVAV